MNEAKATMLGILLLDLEQSDHKQQLTLARTGGGGRCNPPEVFRR